MYQWGRVADGHEKITWAKNTSVDPSDPSYRSIIFGAASGVVNYSPSINFDNSSIIPFVEGFASTWQVVSGDPAYGKFITTGIPYSYNWNFDKRTQGYFWATSTYAKTSNDPCPSTSLRASFIGGILCFIPNKIS